MSGLVVGFCERAGEAVVPAETARVDEVPEKAETERHNAERQHQLAKGATQKTGLFAIEPDNAQAGEELPRRYAQQNGEEQRIDNRDGQKTLQQFGYGAAAEKQFRCEAQSQWSGR